MLTVVRHTSRITLTVQRLPFDDFHLQWIALDADDEGTYFVNRATGYYLKSSATGCKTNDANGLPRNQRTIGKW